MVLCREMTYDIHFKLVIYLLGKALFFLLLYFDTRLEATDLVLEEVMVA